MPTLAIGVPGFNSDKIICITFSMPNVGLKYPDKRTDTFFALGRIVEEHF